MGTWRKAYGALKDSTQVGLAKVNSEFKDLDIAIVKATNHVECPPKERHVRRIFAATAASRPRADVAYCIYVLGRRLYKTHNWTVALKTLIVFHRLFREGDPTFKEEMLCYSRRRSVLQISNFKDDSAWDCSAWVRTYALYLEEQLECFRILKYDIEAEHLNKSGQESNKGHSRTKTLCCPDLLEQLPALQQLLFRLIGCQPERATYGNFLIQYALALVLKESFKIYWAINDGIINLVDMYFDMTKYDAIKAFAIYKRAGQQAEALSEFYQFSKHLDIARTFQFPNLRQPPSSFFATMEEYIREAPGGASASSKNLESEEKNLQTCEQEEVPPVVEEEKPDEQQPPEEEQQPEPEPIVEPEPQPDVTGDLLRLDEVHPAAAEVEQNNASALAIISPEDVPKPSTSLDLLATGSSGWESALVTTPSSNASHVAERKLAGGFDKVLLDSLYEDSARRQQAAAGYSGGSSFDSNSFDRSDPFAMSNSFAPPTGVQMSLMSHQQQQYYYQQPEYCYPPQQQHQQFPQNQQVMTALYQPQYPQQHTVGAGNPFGDPFAAYPQGATQHGTGNII